MSLWFRVLGLGYFGLFVRVGLLIQNLGLTMSGLACRTSSLRVSGCRQTWSFLDHSLPIIINGPVPKQQILSYPTNHQYPFGVWYVGLKSWLCGYLDPLGTPLRDSYGCGLNMYIVGFRFQGLGVRASGFSGFRGLGF